MHYIDIEFYCDVYNGESLSEDDFLFLRERAEEIIEEMTMYRLTPSVMVSLPEIMQNHIKKAICAQIEYLDANGGSDMDNGAMLQSAGLGKFNYSAASGADEGAKQSIYSPRAQRILIPTGLLYRGGRS